MILQTDLLDILFYGRNKAYGAYTLRSGYNSRLSRSIAATFAIAFLFSVSWYVQANFFKGTRSIVAGWPVDSVTLSSVQEHKDEIKKAELIKTHPGQKTAQVANPPLVIVPDDQVHKNITQNNELENSRIGLTTVSGNNDSGNTRPAPSGGGADTVTTHIQQPVAEPDEPLRMAELMPEFPGGNDAFARFMLRNLAEPEDLQQGEKVVVQVQFVVEANGQVDNIEIMHSAGRYDDEVIRVIKKMPQWKPGMQNGIHVPVYLSLPVTFAGRDE